MTATQFSERSSMDEMECCVPPGFRFHPTEEELVGYYLKRKINSLKIDLHVIADIDLYKIEPWDIQEKCKLGYEEEKEWYFFSHKDKKYPTGTRTNRATSGGFWKATGRDKAVMSNNRVIGMRKTLVFYKGRAPNGTKTDWIIHEFRLHLSQHAPPQEEGWVVCRAFKKPSPTHHRHGFEGWSSSHHHHHHHQAQYFRDQMIYAKPALSFADNLNTNEADHLDQVFYPSDEGTSFTHHHHHHRKQAQLVSNDTVLDNNNQQLQVIDELIPQLDSPTASVSARLMAVQESGFTNEDNYREERCNDNDINGQCIDWKSLDNIFDSQFTNDATASAYFSHPNMPFLYTP